MNDALLGLDDVVTGDKELGRLCRQYVRERAARGEIRGATPASYLENLNLFVAFAGQDRQVDRITRRQVERWMEKARVAPGTLRNRLTTLRGFFDYCVDRGLCRANPTIGIRPPRAPRAVPRALQPHEVAGCLRAAPDARGRLMVLLMAQEGLRCQEVAGLEVGDIEVGRRLLLVRRGKGGNERLLPLSDETLAALAEYQAEAAITAGPLFRSRQFPNRGIGSRWVAELVTRWLHEAGSSGTAHALRHTAATDMLDNGANLRDVQMALGHASLATTQRYLSRSTADLRRAMGGRRYRQQLVRPASASGQSPAAG